MQQLSLEKKEALSGIITYYIYHGINVIDSFSETGEDADEIKPGVTKARMKADGRFDYLAERQRQGYPKTEIIKSQTI